MASLKLKMIWCGSFLLAVCSATPAFAWCRWPSPLEAVKTHFPESSTSIPYYEWKTAKPVRYGYGLPLVVERDFILRLWRDGRWEARGTMGNWIRHRGLDAGLRFAAHHSSDHGPLPEWDGFTLYPDWSMGKGGRHHPRSVTQRILGKRDNFTPEMFEMIGDGKFVIQPLVFCSAKRK